MACFFVAPFFAVVNAVSMVVASAPPRAPSASRPADDSAVEDTTNSIDRGDELMGLGEHEDAIAAYAAAFESALRIADNQTRQDARSLVRLKLAKAHRAAHEASGGRGHVTEVARLLAEYAKDSIEPSAEANDLAAWVEANREVGPRERERAPRAGEASEPSSDRRTPNRKMVLAGTAVTGVGAGLSVGFFVALGIYVTARNNRVRADDDSGRTAWGLASQSSAAGSIATGILAGAAIATGIALIVVGKRGKNRDSAGVLGLPLHVRSGSGVGFGGRF